VLILRDLHHLPADVCGGAVAIGNFDGVHRGHVRIVERLLAAARSAGGPAIIFTFDPHPVRVMRPEQCPPPLTWTERKAQLLAQYGIDMVIAYPTDRQLLEMSADHFFQHVVVDALNARAMVEGPNFYFGKNREGNVQRLQTLVTAARMSLEVVEPTHWKGQLVSSSRIRQSIASGEVAEAARMLSAPYRIRGMVTHGAGRGTSLGYPTANLEAVDTLLPKMGVYAGRAWCQEAIYPAAISLGPNPTFGDRLPKVEVHLIECSETLYGRPLEVEFHQRLRGITKFDSQEALIEQLQQDVARTRETMFHQ
jgi:riboflavin kinase / FMN adenylyltransferase